MIIDHTHPEYVKRAEKLGKHRFNGCYFYSCEIVKNIIPHVDTDYNWLTVKAGETCLDHSIVFIHDNVNFEKTYSYLRDYDDLVLVVGIPDMVDRASEFGHAIYLPLSVDVEFVSRFRRKRKIYDLGSFGRKAKTRKRRGFEISKNARVIGGGYPRAAFLSEMAKYKRVYAIGRCAFEAMVLGCEVLPFHPRFPNPDLWQILDNREAADMLQGML